MGADREGGVRRRSARAVAYAACGAVVLAGCASMPDSGDLRDVESTPRQDTQVRVFAVPPSADASPREIVQGFLEALTSDDPDYDTARKYLTAAAAQRWDPEGSTTVLAGAPSTEAASRQAGDQDDADSVTYTLAGTQVAVVDAQQAFAPSDGPYSKNLHLSRDPKTKQWRIDALPEGVVMGKSDFQRNYTSVDKYYFASNSSNSSNSSNASAGASGQPIAVADPVFVRKRVDSMTQTVRSLIEGPTAWLGPVVRTSFPTGTELKKGTGALTPDDQSRLTVPLNDRGSRVGADRCAEMATQLLFTLSNMTPAVDSVELQGSGGRTLCDLTDEQAENVAWHGAAKSPEYVYFLDSKHRLVRIPGTTSSTSALPVPGALGEGAKQLRSVAVSRDEHTAAGVSADGKSLYVTSLGAGGSLGDPVLTSAGATEADRLTTPTWDAHGDLWVADRDPKAPRLLLLEQGGGEPLEVRTPQLPGRIKDVRVAADGVRMALVVEKDGKQSLLIGRIERDDSSGEGPAVIELRSATPELEEITAVSWAGDGRLVVVGSEQGGVKQMRYVQVDGSTPEGPAPAALTGVTAIAASEDETAPLVAYSKDDGIVRLPSGAQWQKVVKDGSAPVYPG